LAPAPHFQKIVLSTWWWHFSIDQVGQFKYMRPVQYQALHLNRGIQIIIILHQSNKIIQKVCFK